MSILTDGQRRENTIIKKQLARKFVVPCFIVKALQSARK
jgi:hypothetical protein